MNRIGHNILFMPAVLCRFLAAGFLFCLAGFFFVTPLCAQQKDGSPWNVPVKAVAIITEDDQGAPLQFPSTVFFDWTMDETYVVTGGKGRISIYGADFFPQISLGRGRGVESPNDLFVDKDGRLYICQGQSAGKSPRLTILNGAFFLEKEIVFADIPGLEKVVPGRIAVAANGTIYIVPANLRGALVLDRDGRFLRWLTPKDRVRIEEEPMVTGESGMPTVAADAVADADEEKSAAAAGEADGATAESLDDTAGAEARKDKTAAADAPADGAEAKHLDQRAAELESLPDFLRPMKKDVDAPVEEADPRSAVQLADVVCDSQGHIYLLSEETSKVYVYNAAEKFLFSFGQKGGSEGKMSRPRALAVDEKRKSISIVDYMRHTILIYNFAGRFLFEVGGYGRSPRWFNFPTDIALNRQGHLIVADLFNKRVQVLDVQYEAGVGLFGPAEKGGK
ncbi:MAG: 6-bladed beta-propeller [Thermodesulfobacteriota bacterium]